MLRRYIDWLPPEQAGTPPMQYLARRRMQLASGLLRDTSAKLVASRRGRGGGERPPWQPADSLVSGPARWA